jgi:hypothetical protein
MRGRTLLVLGIAVIGLALAAAADAPKTEAAKTPWKITGQLEEACTCSAACPCWFGSKPTKMTCGGGQFLFISKGTYGSVALDGLAMGHMAQSPEGKSMMESFGNWNFGYLYLDEKANPQQRDALKAIAMQVLPMKSSTNVEVRVTPITRDIKDKEHTIAIGSYGSFKGHLMEGGLGGSVKITNPPGADPLHHEYMQGQTDKLAYTDAGQNWDVQGTNYMLGSFELNSAQYEKYTAGLAQKMAAAKP